MKYKDLRIDKQDNRTKQIIDVFGQDVFGINNMDRIIEDFHRDMEIFCEDGGNPVIPPNMEAMAKSAFINYFLFYLYGSINSINPDSNFRKGHQVETVSQAMQNIQNMAMRGKTIEADAGSINKNTSLEEKES